MVNVLIGVLFVISIIIVLKQCKGGKHDVGCIAEEVGKVLPEIVVYEENGIDADGMDYSKLTPLLIEAVKALTKRIEELESKL